MHLQQHFRLCQTGFIECGGHLYHGAANNIGGCALNRRVNRGALGKGFARRNFGVDFRHMHFAAKQRRDIALRFGLGFDMFHIIFNAGEFFKIGFDVIARFPARYAQLIGQPESRNAVNNAEINRFGAAAHFRRHLGHRHIKHFRRGHGVNIIAVQERIFQRGNIGHMRQDAQFNLAVIGTDQLMPVRRHKRRANTPPVFGAYRNILQIRLR